jgi:phospholipid transport system substrate-binding protein
VEEKVTGFASLKIDAERSPMRRSFTLAALAGAALLAGHAAHAADATPRADMAPDALVQSVSGEVLDDIRADAALRHGDIAKLQKLIDDKVAPYVDFERMTRLAVGHGWRSATPEQREALMREFRILLVRTYSGALSQVTDHKVKMRPFRSQPGDTEVMVRSEVVPSSGDAIQLDYRLEKTPAGWKIYDVNILGVSLVENFRNSFASEINQGGIDGLIKALADRNRQLAASNKS